MRINFEVENLTQLKEETLRFCSFLDRHGVSSERIFDSRLVWSELVGNILKHSKGTARLCAEIVDGFLELVVLSDKVFIPPATSHCSGVLSENGRGLFLVDSVCAERAMTENGGIKVRISIKNAD